LFFIVAVAVHWQVLTRNDGERAIVVLSFSCPEADAVRSITSDHVRATLIISMSIIRDIGHDKCHMTRILSFDLGGNVPQNLSNTVMKQQATMSLILYDFLKKNEPGPPFPIRFCNTELLNNDDIIRTVVEYNECTSSLTSMSTLLPTTSTTSLSTPMKGISAVHDSTNHDIPSENTHGASSKWHILWNIASRVIVVSLPVVLSILSRQVQIVELPMLAFLITTFLAIRTLVVWEIGMPLKYDEASTHSRHNPTPFKSIRYNFTVDLQGILQFISKQKEEQMSSTSVDISVVHIVASALSQTLSKTKGLRYRHVRIPWLFIDSVVDTSSEPVDATIFFDNASKHSASATAAAVQTIHGADRLNINGIAEAMLNSNTTNERRNSQHSIGQCIVITKARTDDDMTDLTLDSDLHMCHDAGIVVAAVVGDVTLDRRGGMTTSPIKNGNRSRSPLNSSNASTITISQQQQQQRHPRPMLSLSLTIVPPPTKNNKNKNAFSWNDVQKYRSVAEEMKTLLHFPEMCDKT
jgi:START domain